MMLDLSLKFNESYAAFQAKPSDLDSLDSSVHPYSQLQAEGDKLYESGKYEESIKFYERALVNKSDEYRIWNKLGLSQIALKQYQQAISSFEQAIEIDRNIYVAWYNKGNVLRELEHFEDAIVNYNRALDCQSVQHKDWILHNRGLVLSVLDRFEEALNSYDLAISDNPNNFQSWTNRGNLLSYLSRYSEALESFDRSKALNPNEDITWLNRGNVLLVSGRFDEALASYDRALEINPNCDTVWFNRGFLLSELHRANESINSYELSLNLNPNNFIAWNNRGCELADLGYYQEALDSFDRAVGLKSNEALYWNNRGNALQKLGQFENALASYNIALSIDPTFTKALSGHENVISAIEQNNAERIGTKFNSFEKETDRSSSDIVRTVDRDGNIFEYHLKDLYPDEESYNYTNHQSKLFAECLPELIAKYGGHYVVFEDGKVIDEDEDEDVLLDRIWETDFIKERMGVDGHGIYCHFVPARQ
jgi:tetratricopeptide (TPR) repeat protein